MIYKYNEFLNEKISDKLSGKSEDEIIVFLKTLEPNDMLEKAIDLNFFDGIKLAINRGAIMKNWKLKQLFNDGFYEIVKYFIQHTINIMQYSDMFVLLVDKKNIELLEDMFNNGFKVDERVISVVETIARTDDTSFMNFLLNNIDINKYGEYLFIDALYHSNINMIEVFIKHGIDVNLKQYDPIKYSCFNKNYKEIINYLIDNGLKIEIYLTDALKEIIGRGLVEQVIYLVEELGADINTVPDNIVILRNEKEMTKTIKKLKESK